MRTFNTPLFPVISLIFISLMLTGCSHSSAKNDSQPAPILPGQEFNDYWYQGKAELTSYKVTQARYGEYHEGDAVMIFVTEDLNTESQVKHNGGNAPKEPILKLNFNRKFWTGIYPYSILTSVFTPVNQRKSSLKITNSVEEWCGHTYMQMNLRGGKYQGQLHSYFPNEGDQEWTVSPQLSEDEIWTKIRIAPDRLPEGKLEVFPGMMYLRLLHQPAKVVPATAKLTKGNDTSTYTLTYETLKRELSITFKNEFPHEIIEWEEKTMPVFGKKEWMTTRGIKTNALMIDYWSKNGVADSTYRKQLGL